MQQIVEILISMQNVINGIVIALSFKMLEVAHLDKIVKIIKIVFNVLLELMDSNAHGMAFNV